MYSFASNAIRVVLRVGSIPAAKTLVTINVEHRHKHQDKVPQFAWIAQQLAQGQKARVLPFDFTGVNPTLQEQDR